MEEAENGIFYRYLHQYSACLFVCLFVCVQQTSKCLNISDPNCLRNLT